MEVVFVKDSILGNWHKTRAPKAQGKLSAKRKRRRRENPAEGQEILKWLALNSREGAKHTPINFIRS